MHKDYATYPHVCLSHTPLIFPGEFHLGFFLAQTKKDC